MSAGPRLVSYLVWMCAVFSFAANLPQLPKIHFENFAPQARESLEKAVAEVRAKPTDAQANGQLGMILHAYEQYDLAVICYERAHLLALAEFRWTYYLGVAQSALGKHGEASKSFEKALQTRPEYLSAQLKLAESWLAAGRLSESQQLCEAILKRRPELALVHYLLGRIKTARRQPASAAEHYRRACELFENFGAAHYALGLAYRDLGQPDKAREHFARYEKDQNGWPFGEDSILGEVKSLNTASLARLRAAVELEAAGQIDASIAEHKRALEMDSQLIQAHLNLITLYGKAGRFEKAQEHYRAALAINPSLPEIHYNFGVLMVMQERNEEAAVAFRKTLEINPHHAEAHNNYGYVLEQSGRLEDAAQHFRLAIENKPNHRLAHFHLGRLLLHGGMTQEAIDHFRQTLTPEDESTAGFMYALGAAYARAHDREQALYYIREARKRAASLGQKELLASIERDLQILEQGKQ